MDSFHASGVTNTSSGYILTTTYSKPRVFLVNINIQNVPDLMGKVKYVDRGHVKNNLFHGNVWAQMRCRLKHT